MSKKILYLSYLCSSLAGGALEGVFAVPLSETQQIQQLIDDGVPGAQEEAERKLNQCLRKTPKNTSCLVTLSQMIQEEIEQGERNPIDLKKSAALMSQAYFNSPKDPIVQYQLVSLLEALGQDENAKKLFIEATEIFPKHHRTLLELAKKKILLDPIAALKLLESSISMGGDANKAAPLILASLKMQYSKKDFLPKLEEVAKKYKSKWLWHYLGMEYLEEKDYMNASLSFQTALKLGHEIESAFQLAVIHYSYEKKYEDSFREFKILFENLKNHPYAPKRIYALIHGHLALACEKANKVKCSSEEALQVAKLGSEGQSAYKFLMDKFKNIGKVEILKKSALYLEKNDPKSEYPYLIYAEIEKKQNKHKNAVIIYDKLLSLNQDNHEYYALRADSLYNAQEFKPALEDYNKAILLKEDNPIYAYNKACILALLKKWEQSIVYLKKAILGDKTLAILAKKDKDFLNLKENSTYSREFASIVEKNYNEANND